MIRDPLAKLGDQHRACLKDASMGLLGQARPGARFTPLCAPSSGRSYSPQLIGVLRRSGLLEPFGCSSVAATAKGRSFARLIRKRDEIRAHLLRGRIA